MGLDSLPTFKAHLREKYLHEIDVIQRSTAEDPESWTKLDEISAQIENLQKLLKDIDDLTLLSNQERLFDEICCPICFEEMVPPRNVLCCPNGHPICSKCEVQVKTCPTCRMQLDEKSGLRRNPLAEGLIKEISYFHRELQL